ncbi:hypothetical protein HHI36_011104 [Cryptolaemus montrouzieri]|uniref:Echinoderm microtubule-associated protein-like 2 n=1 Tax=Cryptolaemus montrouzieri TaxID=559131 RepID=A0ABD2MKV6_9CUCU
MYRMADVDVLVLQLCEIFRIEENNPSITVFFFHEMLDAENRGLAGRVSDLERKILEQGDELVCLKATLAEALRRITLLEGSRLHQQSPSPAVPLRNGLSKESFRLRPSSYSPSHNADNNRVRPIVMDSPRKIYNSSLPQRKAVHYQSTGSLHSDSQSSSSVSPIPSPSPSTPVTSIKKPPLMAQNSVSSSNSSNSLLHKRWNSTGDFNQSPAMSPTGMQSKFSNKSFLNLYTKSNQFPAPHFKHGTKEATYNEEDHSLSMYLRSRLIKLYAPSDIADSYELTKVNTAPHQRLKLDWVYGYRGKDCRSNLYFLPTGEMVYFVASVVVLYNVEDQYQRHYLGHTDEVKSLAIHPNKMFVATGQCGGHDRRDSRPHVRIWNSVSLHTQIVIGMNDFQVSVCCLSFSRADGGSLLVAVDDVSDHTISVWDWQKGENGFKITDTKCSVDTIISAEFHPLDRNVIVTSGKSHIAFWSLDINGTLFKRVGIFESRDKPKYVTCIAFLQTGETISGDSNGNLAIWGRGTNTIWKLIKNVHDGAIFSICVLKDGSIVTGGGKDGRIVEFDSNLHKLGSDNQIEGHFGGIRVISEGWGSQLLVGTTKNCILCGSTQIGFQPIILGHTDELWGLASHPNLPQFATAGYDKVLQLWDSMSHSILWSKDIGEQAQSVAFSPDGTYVLVGCCSGRWMIFHSQTRDLLCRNNDGNEPIQVIQFSPNGEMVALGSRDNNIYIYQVTEGGLKYSRIGRCSGHTSYITALDWGVDNTTLRSNSADYEIICWNTSTCRPIVQTIYLRDAEWATNSCTVTFNTIGIWPENAEGIDANSCDRSHNQDILATGDDLGRVKLYNYPVNQPKSLCHTCAGHTSHVTAVKFLHQDTRLVSIGGRDTAVLQWTLS